MDAAQFKVAQVLLVDQTQRLVPEATRELVTAQMWLGSDLELD